MRVLLDTNVLISYLLRPDSTGTIQLILRAFLEERFTLLIPEALLEELVVTVRKKHRLAERIPPGELQSFMEILLQFGEGVAKIQEPIPKVTRDPKDDYLLAYALVGKADFLVTGDEDLLVLKDEIKEVHIVTPRQFVEKLSFGSKG